ncbi:antitoxin ParD1/3/4 [Paraburkholderia sp. WC7.3g]|uniref:Type II toxin-antitoxin system ParD family antitoxin n=1 Tax=Paraburkholderia podalyriae TaxID=1938811 RepID=A0ABR7PJ23_9BURK|nr:type II toxin-antitoxin system ParD family antitoxin [Paraburkholderia podalyriae]MBC8746312.1 type II toxin-antitoxin system ParD family antitoxin [Paraburkholderia podalyriae]
MSSKYALSVSLTEHLCHLVNEQVASGRYRTASEVVREALRLLESQLSNRGPSTQNTVAPANRTPASGTRDDDRELPTQTPGRDL